MSEETVSVADLEKLSADGDVKASFKLGSMYLAGEGVDKDPAKARKYLTDAANNGCLPAMEALIDYYSKEKKADAGLYVSHWCRKAILAGSVTAPSVLADYYYLGDGNSNKHAALLYLESAKRQEDDCEREISILTRMLESNWLEPEWKFYGEIIEVLADNGNRDAKHIIRREEIPDPTDDYDLETLLNEVIELPEEVVEKPKPVRQWGRSRGKRALTSLLYDMGIEFSKSSNGLIKTKKGEEIRDDIEKLIAMGYSFKYSYKTDKWTIMDKGRSE